MLDLGWQEFFLIALVAVLVVGPKDLPNVIRTVMKAIRKVRGMARDFQNSVEEVAREAELDDIRKQAQSLTSGDIGETIRNTVDPDGSMMDALNESRSAIEDTRAQAAIDPMVAPAPPAAPRPPDSASVVGAAVRPKSGTGGAASGAPGRPPGKAANVKRTPRQRTLLRRASVKPAGGGAAGPRRIRVGPAAAGLPGQRKPPVG